MACGSIGHPLATLWYPPACSHVAGFATCSIDTCPQQRKNEYIVSVPPCLRGRIASELLWHGRNTPAWRLVQCNVNMPPAILQQLDNFYLTDSDLEDTPSRRDGVDAETEKRLLFYGCQRIQRAVVLLRVPQVVAATAQTLLHRFYCKKSLCYWHIRVRFECRHETALDPAVLPQGCNSLLCLFLWRGSVLA